MLAGNADRERTVDVLRAAFSEGRLTKEEYDERTGRALSARTIEELQDLTSDVPRGPELGPAASPSALPQQQPYPVVHKPYQGYLPGPYGAYGYPLVPPRATTNRAAVASLVFGLATPLTLGVSGLPAVILGHIARNEIRRTGEQGDASAVAGLALGWLALAVLLLVLIAV